MGEGIVGILNERIRELRGVGGGGFYHTARQSCDNA